MHAPTSADVDRHAVPPVSLMSETGVNVTPEDFLDVLAPKFAHWELQFGTYGFSPIREAWLARAARLGEVITARTGTSETTATFETVDATGQLVLSTPKGRQTIPAADIFF
jgi:BirA family biotin operon repressor/biotin-[acetyl-CoA-carboxylase] ligase